MGFLDKLIKVFGFEGDEQPKIQKKTKEIDSAYTGTGAQFKLEEEAPKIINEPEVQQNETQQQNLEVQTPKTQKEVQQIIDEIKTGKTVIINLNNFNDSDKIRALDFLSGAMYSLRGKIQILDGNVYLLSL